MKEIIKTSDFDQWLLNLKDRVARSRILARIDRLALGNPGDVKPVGSGVSEMRIDCGPGYRIYFANRGAVLILLLCGGDKSSQKNDIEKAMRLASEWKEK
jgi:putative addiction module killer protein